MTKRAFLLMGLSILTVVLSHAAGWGQIAMINWADRYRPVTVPNFDQVGTLPYYVLLVIRQLTVWSIPAFLFLSGFFVAYAARGSQPTLGWKTVQTRVTSLLIPYLIWSVMCFIWDWLDGNTSSPLGYLRRLAIGGASGPYYYVPLICQLYLLSPLIIPIARARGWLLLVASALLQLSVFGVIYLGIFGVEILGPSLIVQALTQSWLFFMWAFYFPFGIVCGFHIEQLNGWLARYKWGLLVAVIALGLLAIVEPEVIYRTTDRDWRFVPLTIAPSLYSVAFILSFLAFDKVSIPSSKTVHELGRRSYGIYLLHMTVMASVAKVIRLFAPWMLAHQVLLFAPLIFAFGLGVPLLFMEFVARSPARQAYRYLFG